MDISIVIPLLNEDESIGELYEWINKVMMQHGFSYEVIFVDDGSTDSSWNIIEKLASSSSTVRGIKFRRNYGKAAALNEGFKLTKGNVVVTMDADLQDSPEEIPDLFNMITSGGLDLVSGWKKKRYDPISKTLPTKLFNAATRSMSGIHLHDFNCGLKAYRSDVVKTVELQGEMHRYIPVLAKKAGFTKIGEKVVMHQERKYGVTKFGWERFINGFLDLLTISFIARFGRRPMHFFGLLGTLLFLSGFVVSIVLIIQKLVVVGTGAPYRDIVDQPLFYIALVAIVIGAQMFLAGFLGELISRSLADKDQYSIEKTVG
ncbi:MAG: glycosyltransferase family 2 protein [Bacteroidia bacterium]|nr:glycosyltransferase family 2 protein [Bacteroidia bacterium]